MSRRLPGKTAPFLQHGGQFLIGVYSTCQRGVPVDDEIEVGHASVGMEDRHNDRVTGQQFNLQIDLCLGSHHGSVDDECGANLAY